MGRGDIMTSIIKLELKSMWKTTLFWIGGAMMFLLTAYAKYGAFSEELDYDAVMGNMPEALTIVMGVTSMGLNDVAGYYGMLYNYMLLIGLFLASSVGAKIIASEYKDKTYEFLYTKPISRSKILTAKIIAGLCVILSFAIITGVTSIVFTSSYVDEVITTEVLNQYIVLSTIAMIFTQILVFTITLCLSVAIKNYNKAGIIGSIAVLGMYLVNILYQVNEVNGILRFLSPYSYFPIEEIFYNNILDTDKVIFTLLLTLIITAITYIIHNKKDLSY